MTNSRMTDRFVIGLTNRHFNEDANIKIDGNRSARRVARRLNRLTGKRVRRLANGLANEE